MVQPHATGQPSFQFQMANGSEDEEGEAANASKKTDNTAPQAEDAAAQADAEEAAAEEVASQAEAAGKAFGQTHGQGILSSPTPSYSLRFTKQYLNRLRHNQEVMQKDLKEFAGTIKILMKESANSAREVEALQNKIQILTELLKFSIADAAAERARIGRARVDRAGSPDPILPGAGAPTPGAPTTPSTTSPSVSPVDAQTPPSAAQTPQAKRQCFKPSPPATTTDFQFDPEHVDSGPEPLWAARSPFAELELCIEELPLLSPLSDLSTPGGPSLEGEAAKMASMTPGFTNSIQNAFHRRITHVESGPTGKLTVSVKYTKKEGKQPATNKNGGIERFEFPDNEDDEDDEDNEQ